MMVTRIAVAAAMLAASLAVAPVASAQTDCRRSCDRTYQACSRNAANAASCTRAWHGCKNYCRSGQPAPRAPGAAATPRPRT